MTGGVANPSVIDLVTYDTRTDEVVLVLYEDRDWGQAGERIPDLEAKVETYMKYFRRTGSRRTTEHGGEAGPLPAPLQGGAGARERDALSRIRKERLAPLELRLTVSVLEERISAAGSVPRRPRG